MAPTYGSLRAMPRIGGDIMPGPHDYFTPRSGTRSYRMDRGGYRGLLDPFNGRQNDRRFTSRSPVSSEFMPNLTPARQHGDRGREVDQDPFGDGFDRDGFGYGQRMRSRSPPRGSNGRTYYRSYAAYAEDDMPDLIPADDSDDEYNYGDMRTARNREWDPRTMFPRYRSSTRQSRVPLFTDYRAPSFGIALAIMTACWDLRGGTPD